MLAVRGPGSGLFSARPSWHILEVQHPLPRASPSRTWSGCPRGVGGASPHPAVHRSVFMAQHAGSRARRGSRTRPGRTVRHPLAEQACGLPHSSSTSLGGSWGCRSLGLFTGWLPEEELPVPWPTEAARGLVLAVPWPRLVLLRLSRGLPHGRNATPAPTCHSSDAVGRGRLLYAGSVSFCPGRDPAGLQPEGGLPACLPAFRRLPSGLWRVSVLKWFCRGGSQRLSIYSFLPNATSRRTLCINNYGSRLFFTVIYFFIFIDKNIVPGNHAQLGEVYFLGA